MNTETELLITKYLSGEATSADIVKLSEWIASDENNKVSFMMYNSYWKAKVDAVPEWNGDRAWNKIMAGVKMKDKSSVRRLWLRYTAAAAVISLLIVSTIFLMIDRKVITETVNNYSYISGNSIASVNLPDGTEVSLNRNSVLTYSSLYGKEAREVSLKGEAYFRVVKDAGRKFIVNMDKSHIVVLGTSFNVNYLPEENTLTATLIEGSICFESLEQKVNLEPNQQLSYNIAEDLLSVDRVEPEIISAWKDNLLRYRSIPFAEFVHLLEKQYGVEIVISSDELCEKRVSGTFDVSLSVPQILDLMKKSLSYNWKQNNRKYVINKQ